MNDHLYSENHLLRQQLQALLREARQNESKMRRFDRLQHRLICADSLPELIDLLLSEYKRVFGVEFVTLALVDREYEVTRALESSLGKAPCSGLTLLRSSAPLETLYRGKRTPSLGIFNTAHHQALFNAASGAIASVALLPLTRHGELIGSIHLGSADPHRYAAGCGTDFLERLAEIMAICLENTLSQERLKRLGLTDPLTGVQNRRYFEHRCRIEVSQARRHKHPLACLFLDIDRFKSINDTHGHQTGDEVLMNAASLIQSQLRAGDTIVRYGGEEFVVLLPRTGMHDACHIAERIRGQIAEVNIPMSSGYSINLTISIGIAMLPIGEPAVEDRELSERMIAAADKAVYQAKEEGRNRVVCELPA